MDDTPATAGFCLDRSGKALTEYPPTFMTRGLDAGPNGWEGGLSTRKEERITGTSRATASRKLIDREAWGFLVQSGVGRSRSHDMDGPGWSPAEPE